MTDAETIAELRRQLAERDAEISRMRGVILADRHMTEMLRHEKLRLGLVDDLPDKPRRVSENFEAFLDANRRGPPNDQA
jgi:hypothetical protein